MAALEVLSKVDVFTSSFRVILLNSLSKNIRTCRRSLSTLSSCRYCQVKENVATKRDEKLIEQKPPKLRKQFVNRNPRNPEYFGLNKPRGYSTQYDRRDFYNKLSISISNRHTTATVRHNSDTVLTSATTKEFLITRHLYKTTDINAARNIGRVLAERCTEAGLTRVAWYPGRERNRLKFGNMIITPGLQFFPLKGFHNWVAITSSGHSSPGVPLQSFQLIGIYFPTAPSIFKDHGRDRSIVKQVKAFIKAVQKGGVVLSEPRRIIPMETFYSRTKPKLKRKKWKKMPDSAKRKL